MVREKDARGFATQYEVGKIRISNKGEVRKGKGEREGESCEVEGKL